MLMPGYTPHTGVYLDVEIVPASPGADYCDDWPRIDELDIERDRGADPVVQTLHCYAWIAPRAPGDACTLRLLRAGHSSTLVRATIIDQGVCLMRSPKTRGRPVWLCVTALSGGVLARGPTRRSAARAYWLAARQWPPGHWPAAQALLAAAHRLTRSPRGGEVRA
jgi:hypothetical protein